MTIEPHIGAIELSDGRARLVVAPEHGAAVLHYDWIDAGRAIPLFRPTLPICRTTSDFAMIVMLPWVNRISGGGFMANGVFHALEPNIAGEPFPIHGNGFQSRWTIVRQTGAAIELALTSDGPGPYRYGAVYALRLDDGALSATLDVTNRASIPLPFGLGFHPWIVRHPDTELAARATRFWREDARYLPTEAAPVASTPTMDFNTQHRLPDGWINTSFEGWDGVAEIRSASAGLTLGIEASSTLPVYHVYSPNAAADFVCFEPVSHIPDGFNRRDEMDPCPDDLLAPGATVRAACRFIPNLT